MSDSTEDLITVGSYVIIKRQNYKKLYKVTEKGHVNLGKTQVEMREIIGKRFWSTFEMLPAEKGKNNFVLKEAPEMESWEDLLTELPSGTDNRTITDDGTSQKLTKEEILQLQESGKTGKEIVNSLIENSKSFLDKTGYSQEKYLKKKEKKYCRYLMVLKPDISTLHEIYFKLDQNKIGGLRMDALSQILSYSNVHADGLFLLYDSGSQGLPAAAMLHKIGANTKGQLINMHPGNVAQTTLVQGMNFPKEQLERLYNVNIYSFLRFYYQGEESILEHIASTKKTQENLKNKNKKQKIVEEVKKESKETEIPAGDIQSPEETAETQEEIGEDSSNNLKRKSNDPPEFPPPKKPRWLLETKSAVDLIKETKASGLVVIAKEHPLNIVTALLPFLGISRPFVIFHVHKEPLQETYMALKQKHNVVNLRLVTNFLRSYQVLPDRTHPEILTSDTGGYFLTGFLVE